MSWKHWVVVLLVLGAGIVGQIPRHPAMTDGASGHNHRAPVGGPSVSAPLSDGVPREARRTLVLDVTGMT